MTSVSRDRVSHWYFASGVAGVNLAYDGNRNLTYDGYNTLTYDVENRLVSLTRGGATAQYKYNGLGWLVQKIAGGRT